VFNCFKCGEKGTDLYLISALEGKPLYEVKKKFSKDTKKFVPVVTGTLQTAMAQLSMLEMPRSRPEPTFAEVEYPPFYRPVFPLSKETGPFYQYLIGPKRGLTDQDIEENQLGCCTDGTYKNRVIIPIFMEEKLVGYQGRDITGTATPKILNPFGFNKSKVLFNYDRAAKFDEVVIAEGAFGAIRIGPNAVATLGKLISDEQLRLLEPFKRITIMLDSDAHEEADKTARRLKNLNVFIVFLKTGQPDDYTRKELEKLVSEAVYGRSLAALSTILEGKL